MALVIGENSYITVEEATTIINSYMLPSDPLRVAWTAASNSDKEILLLQSCLQLERLPYTGRKKDKTQSLSFPRQDGNMQPIKLAQAFQAAFLTDYGQQEEMSLRRQLQNAGVKSYKIGNLQETFGGTLSKALTAIQTNAVDALRPYLSGGYRICI